MENQEKRPTCNHCNKQFTHKKNLYQHIRNIHKIEQQAQGLLNCPAVCSQNFNNLRDLRIHLVNQHAFTNEIEKMEFNSFQEFMTWKEEEEKLSLTSYKKNTAAKKLVDGSKRYYFLCHRSGLPTTKLADNERKKALKSQGSCKMGNTCPSAMVVTEMRLKVTVQYFKTHLGHDKDLCFLNLKKSERTAISGKLAQGVSFDSILDEVRNNLDGDIERIHLLNKQDLRNIQLQFGISNSERAHPNDTTIVDLWGTGDLEKRRLVAPSSKPTVSLSTMTLYEAVTDYPRNWTSVMLESNLFFMKLSSDGDQTMLLKIDTDLAVTVKVHQKELSSDHPIKESLPTIITTIGQVQDCINHLDLWRLCPGDTNVRHLNFLKNHPKATKDYQIMDFNSLYHDLCHGLMKSLRCKYCQLLNRRMSGIIRCHIASEAVNSE